MGEIRNATIPIAQIAMNPGNYRKHPDDQLQKLRASLRRFGQVRSVVVQEGAPEHYLMVAGEGITTAATAEGLAEIRADILPADWTPEQVQGYLIADNQGGAEDDPVQLASLLREQQELGLDTTALGFDQGQIDAIMREANDALGTIDFGSLVEPSGGGNAADLQWEVAVIAATPDARDALVSQLRGMGYEPEVSSVRAATA
jgi:ParB-like chromosome segregation protein Spo0J